MLAPKVRRDDSDRLLGALRGQVSDLPVALTVEWRSFTPLSLAILSSDAEETAARHGAVLVFWLDPSSGSNELILVLCEARAQHILIRRIGCDGPVDEICAESAAFVVRAAIGAILGGGEIGIRLPAPPQPEVEPEPKPEPQPEPPPEPPVEPQVEAPMGEEPSQLLEFSASYNLAMYSSEHISIHGVRVATALRLVEWAGAFVAYRLELPFQVENDLMTLELRPRPVELGVRVKKELGRYTFGGGVAAVFDFLSWSIHEKSDQIELRKPPTVRFVPGISPFFCVGIAPGDNWTLFAAAHAEVYFLKKSFVANTESGSEKLGEPWTVRPVFQLGASFVLF